MNKLLLTLLLALLSMIVSCGGDGGSVGVVNSAPLLEGRFVDAPVQGLNYENPSYSGVTGKEGTFYYRKGEVVTFKIGKILLGTSLAKVIVSPLDLVLNGTTDNEAVINISRLLQSLDSIPGDNNIKIPQGVLMNAIKNEMDALTAGLDFSDTGAFDALINNVIQFVTNNVADYATPPSVVDASTAKAHLEASLNQIVSDITGSTGGTSARGYELLADGTVRDKSTSLIWHQDTNSPGLGTSPNVSYRQGSARLHPSDYIDNLNQGVYGTDPVYGNAGYSDWRIPTMQELQNMVDYRFVGPCISDQNGEGTIAPPPVNGFKGGLVYGEPFLLCLDRGECSDEFLLENWKLTQTKFNDSNLSEEYHYAINFYDALVHNLYLDGTIWPVRGSAQ